MLVPGGAGSALLALTRYGSNLRIQASSSDGPGRPRLRCQREFILLFTRDFVLTREKFGRFPHDHLRQGAEKAVAVHAIDQFLVAQAVSPARAIEIIRKPGHRPRATRKNAAALPHRDRLACECV